MRYLLPIIILLLCATACKTSQFTRKERKAIRTVQQSTPATDSVIRWYLKVNPPKNDTTYLPGKDTLIVRDTTIYDSVPVPYPVNHRYTEKHYKDRLIVDTVQVVDKSFVSSLNRRLDELNQQLLQVMDDRDEWKHKAQLRLWIMIAVIAVVILSAVILLRSKIKLLI